MKITASMFNKKTSIVEQLRELEKEKYKQVKPLNQTRNDRIEKHMIKTYEDR
jgi:hypothetical protein